MRRKIILSLILFTFSVSLSGQPKSLSELINTTESAWTGFLQKWIKEAKNNVEVLPKINQATADSALFKSQVTTGNPMGSIVYETGGIFIHHGWIRILGSGSAKMNRNLMDWNKGKTYDTLGGPLPYLLVADDVLGGFFAVNEGGLNPAFKGNVFYLSPESGDWVNTKMTYSEFIRFCMYGDILTFYKGYFWTNWEADVKAINGNQGFACFPFLNTKGGGDINKVKRSVVTIEELWGLYGSVEEEE